VLKKGGDQADLTKEDVIKRTITSVPWSNAASVRTTDDENASSSSSSSSSSSTTTITTATAYLEGALRAEKAAEIGDQRASSVACAKQTEVVALGQRVGDMLGFESEIDGFTDPSDFINVEIKSKQQLEKERKEQEAFDEAEEIDDSGDD
jgi:hypothetical protein